MMIAFEIVQAFVSGDTTIQQNEIRIPREGAFKSCLYIRCEVDSVTPT